MREWESFTNQDQWKIYLKRLMQTNDKALYKAILLISEFQTDEELYKGITLEHNKLGFTACDAQFLTDVSNMIRRGETLTPRVKAISRNKMTKYWRQLMIISKERQTNEQTRKLDSPASNLHDNTLSESISTVSQS